MRRPFGFRFQVLMKMSEINDRKIDKVGTAACLTTLLFWSIGPIFIRFLTGYIDCWTQNMVRYSSAMLFLLPFFVFNMRSRKLPRSIWLLALIPTAANLVMQSLWAMSFYYIDPAFISLLTKTSLVWITGFSLIFFAEERGLLKSKSFWLAMVLSLVGVAGVLVNKEGFGSKRTVIGIVIALTEAACWGLYAVTAKIAFRKTNSRDGFSVVSIYSTIGFVVLAFIFGKPGQCLAMDVKGWSVVVISGVICIAVAHVCFYVSMKRLGATIPSLIFLLSPVIILTLSHYLYKETMNFHQVLFGLILLGGGACSIWAQQHVKKPDYNDDAAESPASCPVEKAACKL
jgi:drug/metabolite transporter (DMT)-like permease